MSILQDKRILIVEDDNNLRYLLKKVLAREGVETLSAADGDEGVRRFFEHRPDLVILDIMMPGQDGWQVYKQIRRMADTPVIFLTALGKENDIVKGLDLGAIDYVTKPFSTSVLLARVRAAFRQASQTSGNIEDNSSTYNDGYLSVDIEQHAVLVRGNTVKLTSTEFRLLAYLFQHAGRMRTFKQILNNVWGEEYQSNIEYIHAYAWRLRKKLEEDPRNPIYLLTEHGLGYRFEKQLPS